MSSTQICEALHRETPDIRGWSSVSTAEAKTMMIGWLLLEVIGFMIRRVHVAGWLNHCALTVALFPFNCSCKSSQLLLTVGGGEVYDVHLMSLKGIKQLAGNTTAIPFFFLGWKSLLSPPTTSGAIVGPVSSSGALWHVERRNPTTSFIINGQHTADPTWHQTSSHWGRIFYQVIS